MMNLELLTFAAKQFNVPQWRKIAIRHAETTMRNHFREDFSCYHMVDYDKSDGTVITKRTVQGFADESAWSRGQAWALYGYTMMFRETGRKEFLTQAEHIAGYLLPRLAANPVPAWDFDAPAGPDTPDDASAGAVMASAFLELSTLEKDAELSRSYLAQALSTIEALCSEKYLASEGEAGGFILKHSTGNLPKGSEIDVPLTYADYYFLEALWRLRHISL